MMARLPGVGLANGPPARDCDLLKMGESRTPFWALRLTMLRRFETPTIRVRLYLRGALSSRRMAAPPVPRPRLSLSMVLPSDAVLILGPMPITLLARISRRKFAGPVPTPSGTIFSPLPTGLGSRHPYRVEIMPGAPQTP